MSSSSLQKKIPIYFDAKAMGSSLKLISVDYIESEDSKLQSRWYQSEQDVDLFIWSDVHDGVSLIKFQVCILGQVVEWSVFENLRTGIIFEYDVLGSENTSESIEFDQILQEYAVEQAKLLIPEVLELEDFDKKLMLEYLDYHEDQDAKFVTRLPHSHQLGQLNSEESKSKTAPTGSSTMHNFRNWLKKFF